MKEKTFKGRLKKIGLYTFACAPILLTMGCLTFTVVDLVKGFEYNDEKVDLKEKIVSECILSDEFQTQLTQSRKDLETQLESGKISSQQYIYQSEKLISHDVIIDFAKDMPQFQEDFELLNYYQKSMDKHGLLCIPGVLATGLSAIGSVVSVNKARDYSDINFDSLSDLYKLDEKMLKKRKVQAEKTL